MINIDETVQFVEKPSSELYSLKVVQGPYLGVVYTYGKVTLHEDEANAQLNVKFDFKLDEVPENLNKEELQNSEDFKNFMGDILTQLLEEQLNNDKSTNANT
jgi:ABC-type Fe2+-enterobactin transport system substrate-binding protein